MQKICGKMQAKYSFPFYLKFSNKKNSEKIENFVWRKHSNSIIALKESAMMTSYSRVMAD